MKPPSSEHQLTLQSIQEQLADADSEWWPFGFVRPETHEPFGTVRCAALALLNGVPAGLLAAVIGKLLGDPVKGVHLLLLPLCISVPLFLAFRVGIVPFWNQRAAKLRLHHERRGKWQRSLME